MHVERAMDVSVDYGSFAHTRVTDDQDFEIGPLMMFFWNVGTRVTPLLGPRPLIMQADQDFFEFLILQGNFQISSVMLYSMLTGVLTTRISKDDATKSASWKEPVIVAVMKMPTRTAPVEK